VTRQTLKRLAVRYLILQEEIDEIEKQLDPLVRAVNPTLLSLSGIGLVTAAALLVAAGDNPEILATRVTFAALAGVAPQPASSGQRTRHRLSRGGNGQANAALHRILLLRRRHQEPRTMAYFARSRAEGLTNRDIMRCLKRHVANEVYAALLNPTTGNPAGRELRTERRPRRKPGCPLPAATPT
jgi:transposase